jgi:hypothetical protein
MATSGSKDAQDDDTQADETDDVEIADDLADDENDTEEESESAPSAKQHGRRSQAMTRRSSPQASASSMSDENKARAIRQVDTLERRIGFLGAALAVVIGLVAFVPFISDPHKRFTGQIARIGKHCPPHFKAVAGNQCSGLLTASRSHWIEELVVVILFAAFLAVATWYGRRSLVAFALLFGGLAVVSTTGSILGIAYIGAGGWLMVRAYRVQKYGTTNAKEVATIVADQRAERKAAGKTSGSSRSSSRTPTTSSKGKKSTPADGKPRPQANKRYTPKTPPRKRPVPPSE